MNATSLPAIAMRPKLPFGFGTTAHVHGYLASLLLAGVVALAAGPGAPAARADKSPRYVAEQPFIAENNAAMTKMMSGMTIKPTGDVDRDFVALMVPHHQGAIDMAQAELRYGHNQQLLRLSQEIIAGQLQEIGAMHVAVGDKVSAFEAMLAGGASEDSAASEAGGAASPAARRPATVEASFLHENAIAVNRMMASMAIKPTGDIDRDFVAMMVPHHEGAIGMAQTELRYGNSASLRHISQEIVVDETQQIALMRLAVDEPLPQSAPSPTDPAPTISVRDDSDAAPMSVPASMQMSPLPSATKRSNQP
jgi:uncharacterized protein (DUF305 family)